MSSSGSQNQQPEIHQARNYVARVKSSLGETSTQYKLFLSTLKSYRTRQLTPLEVISRISNLFRNCNDNEELILGFNAFLPPEYQISEEGLLRRNQEVEADAKVIVDDDEIILFLHSKIIQAVGLHDTPKTFNSALIIASLFLTAISSSNLAFKSSIVLSLISIFILPHILNNLTF